MVRRPKNVHSNFAIVDSGSRRTKFNNVKTSVFRQKENSAMGKNRVLRLRIECRRSVLNVRFCICAKFPRRVEISLREFSGEDFPSCSFFFYLTVEKSLCISSLSFVAANVNFEVFSSWNSLWEWTKIGILGGIRKNSICLCYYISFRYGILSY